MKEVPSTHRIMNHPEAMGLLEVYMQGTKRIEVTLKRIFDNCVITESGCWEWQGGTSGEGRGGNYGRISLDGCTAAVHRVVYQCIHGPIPIKRQVDHECRNRLCCNPCHLRAMTHKQNQKLKAKRART